MPELPEIETVCRSLRPHLVGRTLARIRVLEPRLRVPVEVKQLTSLIGRRIDGITRIAKYIVLDLSGGAVWLFHLGMSGKLICVDASTARRKHDHIVADLAGGMELRYHDPRRFGLSMAAEKYRLYELPQLRDIGIDPFDSRLDGEYLFRFTRLSERRIRDLGGTVHHDGIVPHAEGMDSGGVFFEDPDGIRLEIFASTGAASAGAAPNATGR